METPTIIRMILKKNAVINNNLLFIKLFIIIILLLKNDQIMNLMGEDDVYFSQLRVVTFCYEE